MTDLAAEQDRPLPKTVAQIVQEFANRIEIFRGYADARFEIHHAGGVTAVSVSQEVHGRTWRYLGEYYFEAGASGYVTLINLSSDPAQVVIADAIRFGGGLGSIPEWRHQRRAPLGGSFQVLGPIPGRGDGRPTGDL